MYYAPQEWLADWSKLTGVLTKEGSVNQMDETVNSTATYDMHYYDRPFYDYPDDGSDLPEGLSWRECIDCSKRFVGKGTMKLCRQCRRKRILHGMKHTSSPHDVRASDVPDVPADDYDTAEEKLWKTAPIETCLVKKKEDDSMDTSREERLKTFPSGSNRLENPEAFTGDVVTPTTTGVDIPSTAIGYVPNPTPVCDTKRRLMDLYGQITSISAETGLAVLDIIDRMNRIDAALN